jgi:hypothetical protein
LEDVFDLDPAADTWVAMVHFSGKVFEAGLEGADQFIARRAIAALHAFEQLDQHGRLGGGIGHGTNLVDSASPRSSSTGPSQASMGRSMDHSLDP